MVHPLKEAVRNNDYTAMVTLLQSDIPVTIKNSALSDASQEGYEDLVELLLANGAQAWAENNHALIWASIKGYSNIVELLLANGARVHYRHDDALIYASQNGYYNIVEMLLDNGATVQAQHNAPLMKASTVGRTKIVELLLNRGAQATANFSQAVIHASHKGHTDIVRLLLARGEHLVSDLNKALITASDHGYTQIVALLLENGAHAHAKNSQALVTAISKGYVEIVALLLDQGTHTQAVYNNGLVTAVTKGYTQIVNLLLHNGVHAAFQDVLVIASREGYTGIVALLLNYVDINFRGPDALLIATEKGHTKIVKLLIEHGVSVYFGNGKLLLMASEYGYVDITIILLTQYTYILEHLESYNITSSKIQSTLTQAIQIANTHGHINILRVLVDFETFQNWSSNITIPYDPDNIIHLINYAYYDFLEWSYPYKQKTIMTFVQRFFLSPQQMLTDYINTTMDNWFYSRHAIITYFMKHNPGLSKIENNLVFKYSIGVYQVINSYFRNKGYIDPKFAVSYKYKLKPLCENLLDIFSNIPFTDMDIRVFRGIIEYDNFTFTKIAIGQQYTELSFTSTTVMSNAAGFLKEDQPNILITFIIPQGTPVLFLDPRFHNAEYPEYEVLLAPGLTYEITNKANINGINTVFAKIIGYMDTSY